MSRIDPPRRVRPLFAALGAVVVAILGVAALAIGLWRAEALAAAALSGRYLADPISDIVLTCLHTPLGAAILLGTAYVLRATGCLRRTWDETPPRAYAIWILVRLLAGVEIAFWLVMLVTFLRTRV